MALYKVNDPSKVADALVLNLVWKQLNQILSKFFTDLTNIYVYAESDGNSIVYASLHSDAECKRRNFKIDITLPEWIPLVVQLMDRQRQYYIAVHDRNIALGRDVANPLYHPLFQANEFDYLNQSLNQVIKSAQIRLKQNNIVLAMGKNEYSWTDNIYLELNDVSTLKELSLDGYIVNNDHKRYVAGFPGTVRPLAAAAEEVIILDDLVGFDEF